MLITTSLPFPHLTFKHWALDDREVAVVIVKGTFGTNPDGGLGVIPEQPPIVEVDTFWGEENASSLRAEQELAPAKPYTDVTVNAIARAPGGEALPDWPVSIEVEGRAFYGFQVRGPSEWRKERGKWKLSVPEPPDPSDRAYATVGPHGSCHPDPTIRLGPEPQRSLPHAVPGWGLRSDPHLRQPTAIPVGARTDVGPVDAIGPHHRPPGGSTPGTRRVTGARYRAA